MDFVKPDDIVPAEVWLEVITPLLREGYQLKICPKGRSMVPFLAGGRDEAVLSAPDAGRPFKKNDIVLFRLTNGLHVLHRICRIDGNGIYTLGDGNTAEEGPFKREDILATVDYIIRKGKNIKNDDRKYLLLVSVWRLIRPFRPCVISAYSAIRRFEKRAKKK